MNNARERSRVIRAEDGMEHEHVGETPRRPYRAPRLTVHGSVESITRTGSTRKLEKHPLDFKKGSKIRP